MKWAVTLAVAATATWLVAGNNSLCPPGFEDLSEDPLKPDCLAFILNVGTWEQIEFWCNSMGANVSKITGSLHNRLYNYILETPGLAGHCFWIGGTDWEEEGRWIWESDEDEVAMGTPHWDPCTGDPDGDVDENFICICPDDYYFRDCNDEDVYYGICQI